MIGANGVMNLCIPAWFPSFMIRAHHMPTAITGYRVGAVSLIGGAAGLLIGPMASQWLWRRGYIDTPLRFAAFATIGQFCSCLLIPLVHSDAAALTAAGAALFCVGLPAAIVSSSLQLATPARLRGLAGSCYTFSAQVFGYALGPTLVALLTDRFFHNPEMVGFSLQIVTCCAAFIAGTLLFTVLPYHRRMLAESAAPSVAP
jgi:MFS family permease